MIYTNLGQNLQIKKAQLRVPVLRTLSLTLGECLPTLWLLRSRHDRWQPGKCDPRQMHCCVAATTSVAKIFAKGSEVRSTGTQRGGVPVLRTSEPALDYYLPTLGCYAAAPQLGFFNATAWLNVGRITISFC
jgi:hypothetical protein